jgi:hypothetical protein
LGFPIGFSINSAYKRREVSLVAFSAIKAHALALYYAHRDWVSLTPELPHDDRVRPLIEKLLDAIHHDLSPQGRSELSQNRVYSLFSQLSESIQQLRLSNLAATEVSRVNQYISKMMIDYEKLRNIAMYRTPISLRIYGWVFLNLFPIAFGPYFAELSATSEHFPGVGYFIAIFYTLVLVTLDNIQDKLEDPFDGVGVDDVNLDVIDEYRPLMAS